MFGVSSTAGDDPAGSPIEVPEDIFDRVSRLCLALPEVTVRVDASLTRTRSTPHSFEIRRRSFCLLVAREGRAGKPVPRLVLRADPDERDALLSIGPPFHALRAGRDRIGVRLAGDTDWEEIRELLIESYKRLAPKKLIARIDPQAFSGGLVGVRRVDEHHPEDGLQLPPWHRRGLEG
jgi:hypothetical protein